MGNSSSIVRALSFVLLLAASSAEAAVSITDGSQTLDIDTNQSARVSQGVSTRATYIASTGAASCAAANVLIIEAPAGTGFKLVNWCVSTTNATAAAAVNVFVRRQTAAGSGGTPLTAEGTGTTAVSKMDPADGNFTGIARGGAATTGTAGATLDQVGFHIGELAAGTADPPGNGPFCKYYGQAGEKMPTVTNGTANGLFISMSTSGAGGTSMCSMSATFIVE